MSLLPAVDLVVPVKHLDAAKSRLRPVRLGADAGPGTHARLVLALLLDTVEAARAVAAVRRVLVVTPDPAVAARLRDEGVDTVPEGPAGGLNPVLATTAAGLAAADGTAVVGALQADLPALRPTELAAALDAAVAGFGAGAARAFCADASGDGTTLLLAAPGVPLRPGFGGRSARRHAAAGARALAGNWPGLRRDVDTPADLDEALLLGVGRHTHGLVALCANRR